MVKGILINRRMEEAAALHSLLKMEHADLIAEMQTIENLPTHERLQLARIRRAQQLKVARQKEKEWLKLERMKGNIPSLHNTNGGGPVGAINRHKMKSYAGAVDTVDSAARKHISFENSVVLLEAASRNDMQEVVDLLEAGITPDAANEDGLTALHQCCIDNNVDMLKLLLEYGANVDAQDSDKWTPLHAAATCGHLELVRILVEHDANLLAVNTDGNMPYDLCDDETTLDFIEAEMSKRGVTQELIDETRSATEVQMLNDLMEISRAEGDLEFSDQQGATPLHIAAANGYARVVEFLLEMHVNVDAADHDLWTPVHAAACWGHLEVLEMLAQCGADLNVRNKDNETPSDICEDPEIRERIEQLKTEQESKRLAEAQRRRVRRSQSNNTRAQSVRRTSLRDKTLTTKKDAVEEARLRLQAQEVFTVTANGTATASEVATSLEAKSIDVGTQAKQTKTTTTTSTTSTTSTTFGLSSMSSIYSHLSSSSKLMSSTTADIDNNNQKIIRNHATNVNVNAKAKSSAELPNNACQNHAETNTNHNNNNNNNNNKNINNNHNQSKQQQQQQIQSKQQQQHDNYSLINNNNNGFDGVGVGGFNNTSSKIIQKGYGNGDIDGMQLVKDELDATNKQLYLTGRLNASDDNNKHYILNNGYKALNTERSESVQVQSSKEAANGQINVQVTVLVDTTQHTLSPQQQQQQQQQQEMLNQRLNAEKNNRNQNNHNHQNQTTNSMHKNIGNNFNQKILNSNNNANVLLLPLQNAATLANLKKQRSLSRNSVFNSNNEINSVVVVGTTTSGVAAAGGSSVDANNTTNSLTTTTTATTNQHNNNNNNSNKINNNINNHHNNNNNNSNNNNNNINNNNNNNINNSINSNNHYSNSNSNSSNNKNDVRTTTTTTTTNDDVDDLNTKNYMLVDSNNTNTSPSTILDFHRVPLKNTINNFSNTTSSHLGVGVGANVVKFSGVPGDVVSDSTNSRRCCILM